MSSKEQAAGASDRDAILTALAAEHFAMQGVVSTSVNEQQARASMFLFTVSGAMVALGIVAQSDKFLLFTAAVIPALYAMGLLTILRLVDVGMESLQSLIIVATIRRHYRSLGGPANALFEEALGRWPEGGFRSAPVIGPVLGVLTTAASMIACVAGFIGAAGIAILLYQVARMSLEVSCLIGALFAISQIAIAWVYQMRRIKMIIRMAEERGFVVEGD